MKIGIDVSQIVYQGSGIATYTQNLVENLLAIDQKNDYVFFASSLRQRRKIKDFLAAKRGEKKIYPFPPLFLEQIWNELHLFSIERIIGQVDVFHSSDWLQPPSRAKKVTTIHDVIPFKYPQSFNPRGGHDIVANQKKRLSWVKKEVDLVMADSQATKDDVVKILDIPASKIKVVHLAADQIFQPQSAVKIAAVKKKYGLKKHYLLNVGAREPRKNLKGVIEAFKLLSRTPRLSHPRGERLRHPGGARSMKLVIAGKQAWGENLKIRKFENSKISWLGFVPTEDLPALYSGASCFVYPSFYEGFGLPVLEAMACGCPVVTTNRGSLAEIVGNAAVLVDPEKPKSISQGIEKAIKNQPGLKQKGIKQAQKFSWQKTAREVLKIYQEVYEH